MPAKGINSRCCVKAPTPALRTDTTQVKPVDHMALTEASCAMHLATKPQSPSLATK